MKRVFEGVFHNYGPQDGGWYLTDHHHNSLDSVDAEFQEKPVRITIETIESIILCVFGSRSLTNNVIVHAAIERGIRALDLNMADIKYVVDGGAKGVDNQAHYWARKHKLNTERRFADWDDVEAPGAVIRRGPYGLYNAVAGHWRNQAMAEEATHFIGLRAAGGKSTGTDDMADRVRALGKPLHLEQII